MSFEPIYDHGGVTVYAGDCLDVLATLPDAGVDSVVTDPPYALAFLGQRWDTHTPEGFESWCRAWAAECLRVLKPGGHLVAFGGTRTYHRLAAGIEDAGFEIRDSLHWIYGAGFPKSRNLKGQWQGWGTTLKPGHEPIVLARKPLDGTVAHNVLKHGTGALNIDACRVAYRDAADMDQARVPQPRFGVKDSRAGTYLFRTGEGRNGEVFDPSKGRWPANVLLDTTAAAALDEQSGEQRDGVAVKRNGVTSNGVTGWGKAEPGTPDIGYGGGGGASRFFPVFRYTPKADSAERPVVNGVRHPTVKPLDLMRWLVRLVTPPSGTVLDPFAGTGTTAEACILEGFRCIAIEREADYLPLIRQRIDRRRDPAAYLESRGELDGTLFDLLADDAEVAS